jgi:hypothetical protein
MRIHGAVLLVLEATSIQHQVDSDRRNGGGDRKTSWLSRCQLNYVLWNWVIVGGTRFSHAYLGHLPCVAIDKDESATCHPVLPIHATSHGAVRSEEVEGEMRGTVALSERHDIRASCVPDVETPLDEVSWFRQAQNDGPTGTANDQTPPGQALQSSERTQPRACSFNPFFSDYSDAVPGAVTDIEVAGAKKRTHVPMNQHWLKQNRVDALIHGSVASNAGPSYLSSVDAVGRRAGPSVSLPSLSGPTSELSVD